MAHAVDSAEAEELIRQGVELRQAGHDNRALPLFRKAYELQPVPRTTAQLALCEMALGYSIESERHLRESLAAGRDPWIVKNRKILDDALAQLANQLGDLTVSGQPPGAEVFVNGRSVGRLPLAHAVRLAAGSARVEVRDAGFHPETRTLSIAGGKQERLVVSLRPLKARGHESATLEDRDVQSDRTSGLRMAAWAATSAAIGGLTLGVVETVAWRRRVDEFDRHTRPSNDDSTKRVADCGAADPDRGGTECAAIYGRMQRARNLMILGYATGAALAIGAGALFMLSSHPEGSRVETLACSPSLGIKGAVCSVQF